MNGRPTSFVALLPLVCGCASPSAQPNTLAAASLTSAAPVVASALASTTATEAPAVSAANTTVMAPPPATWWTAAPKSGGSPQDWGWVRCDSDGIVFVADRDRIRPRAATQKSGSARRWTWDVAAGVHARGAPAPPPIHCQLELDAKPPSATLTCKDGAHPDEAFALQPLADASRARHLNELAAMNKPSRDACTRAVACCPKAFDAVTKGATCHPEEEFGDDPNACQSFLSNIKDLLREAKAPVPPECQ